MGVSLEIAVTDLDAYAGRQFTGIAQLEREAATHIQELGPQKNGINRIRLESTLFRNRFFLAIGRDH